MSAHVADLRRDTLADAECELRPFFYFTAFTRGLWRMGLKDLVVEGGDLVEGVGCTGDDRRLGRLDCGLDGDGR